MLKTKISPIDVVVGLVVVLDHLDTVEVKCQRWIFD